MAGRRFTRRRFLELTVLAAAGMAAGCSRAQPSSTSTPRQVSGGQPRPTQSSTATPTTEAGIEAFAENIVSGGVPKDGIPAIDMPQFVAADDIEGLLKPEDVVFILAYEGEVKVYPQIVLVWHEIVNDQVAGMPLSVTYCPLTGSVVAFTGHSPTDEPLTFGTSGKLVNSNLLMYDRQTDSQWPQILGQAITGPMSGADLEEIPLVWTSWERWQERGVDAPILSSSTGYLRSYGQDPYGSYSSANQGYYRDSGLFFPVLARDDQFGPKEVVIGVKVEEARLAIPKQVALEKGVWNLELAGHPLVAVRDPDIETIWVFSRRLGGETFEFRFDNAGILLDQQDRAWRRAGLALEESGGDRLPVADFYDVMWFSWYAFFPDTEVAA